MANLTLSYNVKMGGVLSGLTHEEVKWKHPSQLATSYTTTLNMITVKAVFFSWALFYSILFIPCMLYTWDSC